MKRLLTDILLIVCATFLSMVGTGLEFTLFGSWYEDVLNYLFEPSSNHLVVFAVVSFIAKIVIIFVGLRPRYEV